MTQVLKAFKHRKESHLKIYSYEKELVFLHPLFKKKSKQIKKPGAFFNRKEVFTGRGQQIG